MSRITGVRIGAALALAGVLACSGATASPAPSQGAGSSRQAPPAGAPVILPGLLIPVAGGSIACLGRLPDDLTCYRIVEPAFRCVAKLPRIHCSEVKDPSGDPTEQEGTDR